MLTCSILNTMLSLKQLSLSLRVIYIYKDELQMERSQFKVRLIDVRATLINISD